MLQGGENGLTTVETHAPQPFVGAKCLTMMSVGAAKHPSSPGIQSQRRPVDQPQYAGSPSLDLVLMSVTVRDVQMSRVVINVGKPFARSVTTLFGKSNSPVSGALSPSTQRRPGPHWVDGIVERTSVAGIPAASLAF